MILTIYPQGQILDFVGVVVCLIGWFDFIKVEDRLEHIRDEAMI